MKFRKKNFYGWEGLSLTAGDVELGIAPGIGGRIISLKYHGEELLFVQRQHAGETFDFSTVSDIRAEKRRLGFRVWGGDKTWVAPEKSWWENIPPLELDAGTYTIHSNEDTVVLQSPLCRETGLMITREIDLSPTGEIRLKETLTNRSEATKTFGAWNVTQILRPAEVDIDIDPAHFCLYDDEAYRACRPETVLTGSSGRSVLACRDDTHFKFGGLARKGDIKVRLSRGRGAVTFIKSFDVFPNRPYAHGSSVEVYNSPFHEYCEVEIHSPLAELNSGQSLDFRQTWCLYGTG